MPKAALRKYRLLDGGEVDLRSLDARERAFLADLEKMGRQGISYFEIYRTALGPGSPALRGRNRVDRHIVESPLYRAAEDIVTRIGIKQGLVLAPEFEHERTKAPDDASMISVAQAADLIGITRAAVYKAIEKASLRATRIGNVMVVNRASALAYRAQRTQGAEERHTGTGAHRGRGKRTAEPAPSHTS